MSAGWCMQWYHDSYLAIYVKQRLKIVGFWETGMNGIEASLYAHLVRLMRPWHSTAWTLHAMCGLLSHLTCITPSCPSLFVQLQAPSPCNCSCRSKEWYFRQSFEASGAYVEHLWGIYDASWMSMCSCDVPLRPRMTFGLLTADCLQGKGLQTYAAGCDLGELCTWQDHR